MEEHSDMNRGSIFYINLNAKLIPKIPAKRWAQRSLSPTHCISLLSCIRLYEWNNYNCWSWLGDNYSNLYKLNLFTLVHFL